MRRKIRVLIIDREGIVRSGLSAMINQKESSMVELGTIGEGGGSEIETLRRRSPDTRLVVFAPVYDSASGEVLRQRLTKAGAAGLSEREREVMKLIARGLRTREIAEKLSVSHKTVEKHRTNLMRKLGLRTAAAVAAYATSLGYLIP